MLPLTDAPERRNVYRTRAQKFFGSPFTGDMISFTHGFSRVLGSEMLVRETVLNGFISKPPLPRMAKARRE